MSNERQGYLFSSEARQVALSSKLELTGIRLISDYRDIDIATTNEINRAFDNLLVDDNQRSTDFALFLERDPKDRVVFGSFQDVREFVRAVRRSKKINVASTSEKKLSRNADTLPIVNVSRPLSIDFGNSDRQVVRYYGALDNDNGDVVALVEGVPNSLQYKISVAAWDRITIDYMINALASFFFRMKSDTKFTAHVTLMNGVHDAECAFVDNMAVTFDDVSAVIEEQRLYAVEALISVNADMLVAWEVTESVEKWTERVGFTVNGR